MLTCVEPCLTFKVGPHRARKRLELRSFNGKCLHQYFYLIDPRLGWLNVRLQTWFPFTVHVVVNGREWLSRELRRRGIDFEQRENCFVDIADVPRARRQHTVAPMLHYVSLPPFTPSCRSTSAPVPPAAAAR